MQRSDWAAARDLMWFGDAERAVEAEEIRRRARMLVADAACAAAPPGDERTAPGAGVERMAGAPGGSPARSHSQTALLAFELAHAGIGLAREAVSDVAAGGEARDVAAAAAGAASVIAICERAVGEGRVAARDASFRLAGVLAGAQAGASLAFAAARLLDAKAEGGDEALASLMPDACRTWAGTRAAALALEAAQITGDHGEGNAAAAVLRASWLADGCDRARARLAAAVEDAGLPAALSAWVEQLRQVASHRPGSGACTLATAVQMWLRTRACLAERASRGAVPETLLQSGRLALADLLPSLAAGRAYLFDLVELRARTRSPGEMAGMAALLTDLAHAEMARVAGETGRLAAAVVFGSNRHPAWDAGECAACYQADDLDELDAVFPGIASSARAYGDVVETDGSHAAKAGPCVKFHGLEAFLDLRAKLDGCLSGAWLARDRAAGRLCEMGPAAGDTAGA